jgi:hypothetical protein
MHRLGRRPADPRTDATHRTIRETYFNAPWMKFRVGQNFGHSASRQATRRLVLLLNHRNVRANEGRVGLFTIGALSSSPSLRRLPLSSSSGHASSSYLLILACPSSCSMTGVNVAVVVDCCLFCCLLRWLVRDGTIMRRREPKLEVSSTWNGSVGPMYCWVLGSYGCAKRKQ